MKQNFEEAFKKLNLENSNDCSSKGENYHDMKNIYEKNIQMKAEFDNYLEKVKSCEEWNINLINETFLLILISFLFYKLN